MIRSSRFFFQPNSKHITLFHLKQFLNSRPYLNSGSNSDVFDSQFQSSLTNFQTYHRLKIQDGTLNAETYAQIGSEMSSAHINIISVHSQMLKYLLYGARCSALGRQRFLIVGFSDKEFSLINEQVKFMGDSPVCTKAFENAGLVSVHSMIFEGGLVFVHDKLLGTMANNAKWGGSEYLRIKTRQMWEDNQTTADVTPVGPSK